MKSIKEMTDAVIDFAIDGMYSEIEEWDEEDGHHTNVKLSPKPELYEKLNMFFGDFYVELIAETLKNQFDKKSEEL